MVACAIGMGLPEVYCLNWSIDRRNNLGKRYLRGVAGQHIPTANSSFGTNQPGALESQKNLLKIGLGESGSLCDVSD
jgi:hypothetical protein